MAKSATATAAAPKIRPIGEKLLVRRVEAESRTKGGIVLPDTAKEKPREGKIISTGDGRRLENGERVAFQVKVGDRVLFTNYAGTELKLGGEELLILEESDVLAVLE